MPMLRGIANSQWFRRAVEHLLLLTFGQLAPRRYGPLPQAQIGVGHNTLHVNLLLSTKTCAGRACAMWTIKAKGARSDFWQTNATVDTSSFLREKYFFAVN